MLLFCRLALLIRSFFAIVRYTMAALDAIELAAESEVAADIEGFSPAPGAAEPTPNELAADQRSLLALCDAGELAAEPNELALFDAGELAAEPPPGCRPTPPWDLWFWTTVSAAAGEPHNGRFYFLQNSVTGESRWLTVSASSQVEWLLAVEPVARHWVHPAPLGLPPSAWPPLDWPGRQHWWLRTAPWEEDEAGLYCDLCRKWAIVAHLNSKEHLRKEMSPHDFWREPGGRW